ncbi:MAG: hypothetical protein M9894_14100 [Planctomycetes bacterium]|nr:hypothetical protein [Planctomycetota bacterium]
MSDAAWREALRAWEASPHDQDLLRRAVAAGRRAGEPVGWLLDREVTPRAVFRSGQPFGIHALVPADGNPYAAANWDPARRAFVRWHRTVDLGQTPGEIEVPPHLFWWVAPEGHLGKRLARVLADAAAQGVTGLDLSNSRVTDDDLAPLADMAALRVVLLQSCKKITGAALHRLPGGLRLLALCGSPRVAEDAWPALARLPDLTYLDLRWIELTPDAASTLADSARGLTHLDLGGCKRLGNAAVAALGALPELRYLAVNGTNVSRAGVEPLAALTRLEHLDLSWCGRLTDGALRPIAGLPALQSLDLGGCGNVTPEGLAQLRALPRLRHLDLGGVRAADVARLEALRQALPGCEVSFQLLRGY